MNAIARAKLWRNGVFVVYVIGGNAFLDLALGVRTLPRWGIILLGYFLFVAVRWLWVRRGRLVSAEFNEE